MALKETVLKRLLFFRHGKSDWSAPAQGDHERPLNARGSKAARIMGRFLSRAGQVPPRVISSSAVRALSTLELAREAGGWECDVRVTPALYEATPADVIEEIRSEPDASESLLLVGHEPTWSAMIGLLCQGITARFPTAAMARVDLSISSWREARLGGGQLVWLVPPKLFSKGNFDSLR
ncbi:MAG: histidine phosphatase family protein [Planctomycetes bacterium]|nr:histidine phosphatase family protein [Planctomycetota bacterium]